MLRRLAVNELGSLLATPTWTVHDLIDHTAPLKFPPSFDQVKRLAHLAGLDTPDESMVQALSDQLRFVETLRDVDTAGVEPLIRLVAPLEFDGSTPTGGEPQEVGKWTPTSLASESQRGFFVVKDGLHRDSPASADDRLRD